MKHDDETLQDAIDAAFQTNGKKYGGNLVTDPTNEPFWSREDPARLALAKAFLAKLPEAQPILADDGRSLGEVCADAALAAGLNMATSKECDEAAAQAVANVVLAQAIRRIEAVPVEEVAEIIRRQWLDRGGWIEPAAEAVRARLIAAARGEGQAKEVPQVVHVNTTGCKPMTEETAQALGAMVKAATRIEITEIPDKQPGPVGTLAYAPQAEAKYEEAEREVANRQAALLAAATTIDNLKAEKDRWYEKAKRENELYLKEVEKYSKAIARADKAEAELAALKSSPIGILRPLSEAGPVPDGCVRINGHFYADKWYLGWQKDDKDTHFADIRLPVTETPAAPTSTSSPSSRFRWGRRM